MQSSSPSSVDLPDYFNHPEHVRVIREVVDPLVEAKHTIQFEIR